MHALGPLPRGSRVAGAAIAFALAAAAALPAGAQAAADLQHDAYTVTNAGAGGRGSNHGNALWPGDSFSLQESVANRGDSAAAGVSGTISSSAPWVSFTAASSSYPDIPAGQARTNFSPFNGALAASAECGVRLPLDLNLTSGGAVQINSLPRPGRTATSVSSYRISLSIPTGSEGTPTAYDSGQVPRTISGGASTTSSLQVATPGRVKHVRVRIGHIAQSHTADLAVDLIAPDGTTVRLVGGQGGAGHDFTNTVFDDRAAGPIDGQAAPFSDTYRPEQPLSVLDGKQAQGTWTLRVSDAPGGAPGSLAAWGADISPAVCSPGGPPGSTGGGPQGSTGGGPQGSTGGGSQGTGGGIQGSTGGGALLPPGAPGQPFVANLLGAPIQRIRNVAAHGMALSCGASHTVHCRVDAYLTATTARRLGLRVRSRARGPVRVGSGSVRVGAHRTASFRLRFSPTVRRALGRRRLRSLVLSVKGVARDAAGARVALVRVVLLRR